MHTTRWPRGFWSHARCGLLCFTLGVLGFHSGSLAQVGDPHLGESMRLAVAKAWAPTIFHDESHEFVSPFSGFNPADTLLGLFYDGNEDLRDNGENLYRLSKNEIGEALKNTAVYYSVIETETHFYINYILYHALDLNPKGHVHDTENIWTVVVKDGSPYGKLVMQITNAHGYGMIYGPRELEEKEWRDRLRPRFGLRALPYLDRYSIEHDKEGRPEYIRRAHSESFKVFVATKSHAIYKFHSAAWESRIPGVIYVSESCDDCMVAAHEQAGGGLVRTYQLQSWDSLMEKYFSSKKSPGTSGLEMLFVEEARRFTPLSAFYRPRLLPAYLAPGLEEGQPRANLFYCNSFQGPGNLSDPASIHEYFAAESNETISHTYLFNPYLIREERPHRVAQLKNPKSASLFGVIGQFFFEKIN